MKRVDVKAAANDAEMKMLGKTGAELAKALAEIAVEGDAVETRAERMLALVRSKGIVDERSFSAAIRVAYRANGWRATRGRPKLDEKALESVPATVKQYVSSVRAAFRLKVDGRSMRTFSALRKAVSDARAAKRAKVRSKDPNMAGIHVLKDLWLDKRLRCDLDFAPIDKCNSTVNLIERGNHAQRCRCCSPPTHARTPRRGRLFDRVRRRIARGER